MGRCRNCKFWRHEWGVNIRYQTGTCKEILVPSGARAVDCLSGGREVKTWGNFGCIRYRPVSLLNTIKNELKYINSLKSNQ